jgi:hypothetical protein
VDAALRRIDAGIPLGSDGVPLPASSSLLDVEVPGSESEEISDCSDADDLLLTESEQAAKSDIWHEVNKAFLEDWSHREAQRKKDKEEAAKREPRPKRKPLLPAANAVEATQLALQKVGAKKVDLDSLASLFES